MGRSGRAWISEAASVASPEALVPRDLQKSVVRHQIDAVVLRHGSDELSPSESLGLREVRFLAHQEHEHG